MNEITGQTSITINVPIQAAYDYLADFTRHPEWVKNVFRVMPFQKGNTGVGAKFRTMEFTPPTTIGRAIAATLQYTLGVFKGVAPMSICEITALESPHRIAWVGYLPQGKSLPQGKGGEFNRAEWEFELVAQGNDTQVIQRFRYLPQTSGARKMIAALGDGRGIAASCAASLKKLKRVLEQQVVPGMARSAVAL